jgi:hypothetical protein
MIKFSFFLFLTLISNFAYAVTYDSARIDTIAKLNSSSCQPNNNCTYVVANSRFEISRFYTPTGQFLDYTYKPFTGDASCPTGQSRLTLLDACAVNCTPPQTPDGFGGCAIQECTGGTVLNQTSGQCQMPPTCGSTEYYDNATNSCLLRDLTCQPHEHANETDDACLPDPPISCPPLMHDDGTYNCVSDDPIACTPTQTHGYINGQMQCIPKSNPAQAGADAAAAQAAANAAAQTAANDAAASAAAADALAADPTNPSLQAAAAAAAATAAASQAAADAAQQVADNLKDIAKETTQKSISETLDDIKNHHGESASSGGASCNSPPQCAGDPIQCAAVLSNHNLLCQGDPASQGMVDDALGDPVTETTSETTLANLDSTGLGISSQCPAPQVYTVNGFSMSIDLSPFCQLAQIFGYMLVITASFISLRILTQ